MPWHVSMQTAIYQYISNKPKEPSLWFFGKKEEREGMKTKIFNLERNAPQFLYFNPTDDRKPNPPKPEPQEQQKEQTPKSKNSSTQQSKQKSNLIPGEIEAIKALRANPHIPEDAKPPLPEGY